MANPAPSSALVQQRPPVIRQRLALGLMLIAIPCSMFWLDRDVALACGALKRDFPAVIAPFQAMTDIGKSMWYLYPLAVYGTLMLALQRLRPAEKPRWRRHFFITLFIFANIALSGLAVDIIKIIVGRPRPVLLLEENIFNQFTAFAFKSRWWSFPSGHSATMLSLALGVGAVWPRARLFLLPLAGLGAASRVIVTAHYASDMIGGLLVACLVFMGLTQLFEVRGWVTWSKRPR